MVLLVCSGAVLGAIGVYPPFVEFAGAGASVPLLGFGNTLFKGIKEAANKAVELAKKPNHEMVHKFDKKVEDAIEKVLKEGYRTTDIMSEGKTLVGTREMGDLIVSHL